MDFHYGQIVEKAIRRNGYSITELARLTNVNRRSVYNWFSQRHLKPEIIYRIGNALDYDFSTDLPQIFSPTDFQPKQATPYIQYAPPVITYADNSDTWKDKYIKLLEEFNSLLAAQPAVDLSNK